jgi:hypothetical protein
MKNLRQLVAGSMLGLAGIAIAGEPVQYINEVPQVFDQNFSKKTGDGFSVVLFYSSNPPSQERKFKMDLTEKMYLQIINESGMGFDSFLRYDTQRLADKLQNTTTVNSHMIDNFGFVKSPTLAAYCGGERIFILEGCDPKSEAHIEAGKNFLVKKLSSYISTCQ